MTQHVVPAEEWMDVLARLNAAETRAEKAEADLAAARAEIARVAALAEGALVVTERRHQIELAALRAQSEAATRLAEACDKAGVFSHPAPAEYIQLLEKYRAARARTP